MAPEGSPSIAAFSSIATWSGSLLVILLLAGCSGGGDSGGGGAGTPAPTAHATVDSTVAVGSPTTLDGSASESQAGLPLSYQWTLTAKPSGSTAFLTNATSVRSTFTPDVPGTYTASLVVRDVVASQPDTVSTTAVTGNVAPTANAGPDGGATPGNPIILDGTASRDPNGTAVTYNWRIVEQPPGSNPTLTNATSATPTFTADLPGRYVIALTCSDGSLTSPVDQVVITVATGNLPPLANAGPDQAVTAGQLVTLNGAGSSDPNGDPLTYSWCLQGRPEGSNATLTGANTAQPTFTPDTAGSYIFCLIVSDGKAASAADSVVVEAQPAVTPPPPGNPGWHTLYEENFEGQTTVFANGVPSWMLDSFQFTDRFSDGGAYFQAMGVTPPTAFRAEWPFGKDGWLTAAGYSRSNATDLTSLIAIVADPAGGANHVLKIASPVHTDGLVVRPSFALPGTRYRVCLRVGYAAFGDGDPAASNLNGYLGGERSEPWFNDDSTLQNGFYWLTILDDVPRPHNNVWIHHHRKVVIDSDNNKEAWTEMWTGTSFQNDGRHPIMMFAYDRGGVDLDRTGHPLLSWSNGTLQPSGFVRAVDAYKDNTWYSACIERNPTDFVLTIAGDFKYGGLQTYVGLIPVSAVYRAESGVPDFFMFGDPHNNYYRGQVFYDDLKLEEWLD